MLYCVNLIPRVTHTDLSCLCSAVSAARRTLGLSFPLLIGSLGRVPSCIFLHPLYQSFLSFVVSAARRTFFRSFLHYRSVSEQKIKFCNTKKIE